MVKHKTKRPTRAQKIAETKRLKEAGKVFLAFHEETSWAHDKLASSTADLSPESVEFMRLDLKRRADHADHATAIKAENAALDLAAKVQANKEAEL